MGSEVVTLCFFAWPATSKRGAAPDREGMEKSDSETGVKWTLAKCKVLHQSCCWRQQPLGPSHVGGALRADDNLGWASSLRELGGKLEQAGSGDEDLGGGGTPAAYLDHKQNHFRDVRGLDHQVRVQSGALVYHWGVYIPAYRHTCLHHIYIHTNTHTHTYTHIYMFTNTHTHTYTHIYTKDTKK